MGASPYLIACIYLALAVAYGVVAPPFESPDEVGHFFTSKYIADYGQLPVPEKGLSEQYLYGQEGTQPPLYYLVGALVLRLGGVQTEDAWRYLRVNPHTTCGSPHLTGNKGFLAHDPAREAFPWRDSILALHILRLYSTVLGLATVLGVCAIARLCFPARPWVALLAVALTVLNPQNLFVSAGVNNDNLLVPLCTWSLYLMLRSVRRGLTPAVSVLTGILTGLAALTKMAGVLMLALDGLAVLFAAWCHHRDAARTRAAPSIISLISQVIGHYSLVVIPALLVGGWWYLRNALLYGDPTLIEHHLAIVSRRDPTPLSHILHEIPSIFYSYWGRFTCDISPGPWYYLFWGLVVLAGLGGLASRWRKLSPRQRINMFLMVIWFFLVFIGWFRWNLSASGVQGRLLFPATASLSVLVASGLASWTRGRRWLAKVLLLGWVGLALWVLFGFIRPTFAPPPRLASAEGLQVPQRVNGSFGDRDRRIDLLGYGVQPTDLEAGETLEVTLALSTPRSLPDTYSMGLWLVSAIPGDTARLAGLDTWPGDGNYPTTAWKPGEIIVDTYRIAAPRDVPRVQAWMVQLNIYRSGQDEWLPFSLDSQVIEDRAILGWVRVGAGGALDVPSAALLEQAPVFGGTMALEGAQVRRVEEADEVRVTLWWEALAPVQADYTVFMHLVDAGGQLVGDGDAPPLLGGFPTGMWRPGDAVMDEHIVPLSSNLRAGEYAVRVGWYHPGTNARLPVDDRDYVELDGKVCIP